MSVSVENIPEQLRTTVPVLVERAGDTFAATVLPAATSAAYRATEAGKAAAPHLRRAVDLAVDRGAELAAAAASSETAREVRRRAAGAAAAALGDVPVAVAPRGRWQIAAVFAIGVAAGAAAATWTQRQPPPPPLTSPTVTPDALVDPPDPFVPGDAGDGDAGGRDAGG